MIEFILKDIADVYIRENFKRLGVWVKSLKLLKANWVFYEITFDVAVTNQRYPHRLGYLPKDIILTNVSDSASVIFNYDLFDKEFFDLTTSGACTVRFFAGTFAETL